MSTEGFKRVATFEGARAGVDVKNDRSACAATAGGGEPHGERRSTCWGRVDRLYGVGQPLCHCLRSTTRIEEAPALLAHPFVADRVVDQRDDLRGERFWRVCDDGVDAGLEVVAFHADAGPNDRQSESHRLADLTFESAAETDRDDRDAARREIGPGVRDEAGDRDAVVRVAQRPRRWARCR